MADEAGSDEIFERLENGQDGENVEEMDGGDETNRGGRVDDPELEAIKARVREMKEEAEKLKQLQSEVDKQMNLGSPPSISETHHSFYIFSSQLLYLSNSIQ
uniref:Uncharacterized protein n=1 Tax=Homalodisca liturata TaxID=320908 RepID=A0A1B6JUZ8_9HEMI